MPGGNSFIARNNLQFVLSVVFTLTAMLGALIMGAALNWHFIRSLTAIISQDHRQIIGQVNANLEGYLQNTIKISDTALYCIGLNADSGGEPLCDSFSLIHKMWSDQLAAIAVFDGNGALVAASPYDTLKEDAAPAEAAWFRIARENPDAHHFFAPHIQNLFERTDISYRRVASLSRAVTLRSGGEEIDGVLLVDMSFSRIDEICDEAQIGPHGYIYVTDADGNILYHPAQQQIYSGLRQENNMAEALLEEGSHRTKFLKHNRIVTVQTVGYTGWKIIGVGYLNEIIPYTQTSLLVAIAFILTMTVLILTNYFVSSRVTLPVRRLEQTVLMIDRESMDILVPTGGAMEIRHLGQAIQTLLMRVCVLMDIIVAEQEKKRLYEFDMLQAQVNPHFLYNSLDSIVRLIEWGDKNEASTMVKALSRFFRVTLSRGSGIIPLSSEIEHVRSYLTIQNIRFQEKFSFTIDVDEDVLNLRVIKLILQPIVENAIHHGLNFIDGDGLIAIRAYIARDGALCLEIEDNGTGIPPKRLAALLDKPVDGSRGTGMGLYNVQQRIRLFFGDDYGLTINSEPDVGTCVVVRLPTEPYEEDEEA